MSAINRLHSQDSLAIELITPEWGDHNTFKLRMENICRFRKEEEFQAQLEVLRLGLEGYSIKDRLQTLTEQQRTWTEFPDQTAVNDSPESVLLVKQYLLALEQELRHQNNVLREHQEHLQKAMQAMEDAGRARRRTEYLRDQKLHP